MNINPEQMSDNVEAPPAPGGKGVGFVFTKMIDGAEVKVFLSILEPAGGSKGYTVRLDLLVRAVRKKRRCLDELSVRVKFWISLVVLCLPPSKLIK